MNIKMECFICKGGCGICVSRHLKEDSPVAVKKEFQLEKTFYFYSVN